MPLHVASSRLGRTRPGFTLIEMLVVIAIIGVLAGILLPALVKIKDKGKEVYCANNLRQLSIALRAYCFRYNDNFPDFGDGPSWGYRLHPMDLMCQTMGLIGENDDFLSVRVVPKVALCPACRIDASYGEDYRSRHYQVSSHLDSTVHTIAWMDYMTRVARDSIPGGYPWPQIQPAKWWACFQPYKLALVTRPSSVVAFMDSNDETASKGGDLYDWRVTPTNMYYHMIPNRHRGGGNMAFLDGHVEWKIRDYFLKHKNQPMWLFGSDYTDSNVWYPSLFGG
jgi:prepilin-type N-terminal cleavage/methylation domain-containing protein/prepilin-type processing-associated H-X9-DG protein